MLPAAFVVGLALVCAKQSPADKLEPAQVAEDLAQLEHAVRTEWSYFEARTASGEVDFDALMEVARDRLDGGCTRGEMGAVLRELVAGLHDGHAALAVPGVELGHPRRLPLGLFECSEGIAATRVSEAPGGASDSSTIEPGELVRRIAGRPIAEALADAERRAFGSTPLMRRSEALAALCRSEAAAVELEVESHDGKLRLVRVPTLEDDPAGSSTRGQGAPPSLAWPRADVALLTIPSFALAEWKRWLAASQAERDGMLPETKERFDALIDQVIERKARALLIDLRGNPGGTDSLGIHVAQRLLEKPFVYFQLSTKMDGRWSEPSGFTYEPRRPFSGKVVLLIDAGTFSTASNFARCLRDLRSALSVVGRPDGAGTGAPRRIVELRHSMAAITLCTHRVRGPAGAINEGNPTRPDVVVNWSREDLRTGRDPDLEAAMSLLD